MNAELMNELGRLSSDTLAIINEALDRYLKHGRWNGYNKDDVERVAKLPEQEKEDAISQIRISDNGPELTSEQIDQISQFMDLILDAMCISEAREESSKLLKDLEKYLKNEEQ